MQTTIQAIVNQKGGVGKSFSCINIGVGLARAGKKVLLVDFDPQASMTIALGYPQPDRIPMTVTDLMTKIIEDETIQHGEGIIHHQEGIDLLPANIQLSGMEVTLVNTISRETVLRQYLNISVCPAHLTVYEGQNLYEILDIPDQDIESILCIIVRLQRKTSVAEM